MVTATIITAAITTAIAVKRTFDARLPLVLVDVEVHVDVRQLESPVAVAFASRSLNAAVQCQHGPLHPLRSLTNLPLRTGRVFHSPQLQWLVCAAI